MKLDKLLLNHSIIGVAGNRSTGKSMTVLSELVALKEEYPNVPIYTLGVEESLEPYLMSRGIFALESRQDLLDLKIKNAIIYVDEIATIFDTRNRSKQLEKFERFFDRLEHNNVKIIMSTAREGFWNKFACSRVTAFIVKEVEYEALVNGTWLKQAVLSVRSISDYRLLCPKNRFYLVTNSDELVQKYQCDYSEDLDSKKDNISLFGKRNLYKEEEEEKSKKNCLNKCLRKGENKNDNS